YKAGEPRDGQERDSHRGAEVGLLALGAQPGEMGEEAGGNRLEELQRRPGDHQDVEDVARRGGAGGGVYEQRAGVQECLLGEHDQEYGGGEAASASESELRRVRRGWRLGGGLRTGGRAAEPAQESERDDDQREGG